MMNKLLGKIKNPKLRNALASPSLRARVLFAISILGAVAFAAFNAAAGILYQSIWYGSLAIYYILITLQKLLLVVFGAIVVHKWADDEARLLRERQKIYLTNGVLLLILNLGLTASSIQMSTTEKPTVAGKIFAIATAAYAFFKITTAIINMVQTRKTQDILLQVIRNINFVCAVVSMLALTSTLICTFGDFSEMRVMLACVSVGVGLLITALGVFMIVKGSRAIRNKE